MCWHILALFYVVSVRYVFYIVKAPVYSHISVFSYSVWKYVVQEALQFLGGLCYINKFLLVEYMFPILQFSLFWKILLIFVWAVESKLQQVFWSLQSNFQIPVYKQDALFHSFWFMYSLLFKLSAYEYLKVLPVSVNFSENLFIFLADLYRDKILTLEMPLSFRVVASASVFLRLTLFMFITG